jgi:hypothetical protein
MNEVNETNICLCGAPIAPGEHHCGECGASPKVDHTVIRELKVGDRVRLRRSVERFPMFIVEAGATGVVTYVPATKNDGSYVTGTSLDVKMDDPVSDDDEIVDEWDNEIIWAHDYLLNEAHLDVVRVAPDSLNHPFHVRDLRAMFDGITDEQVNAIRAQANAYDEAWVDADGLESIRRGDGFAAPTDGKVSVAFAYNALNGELGLEVTVFAADGTVTESQDFG